MNRPDGSLQEVLRAAFRASEDGAPESLSQLQELLREHPEARPDVVRFMSLRAQLHWMLAQPQSHAAAQRAARPLRGRSRARRLRFAGAAALLVSAAFLAWTMRPGPQALLARSIHCISRETGAPLTEGPLRAGERLDFITGLARIEFAGGTELIARGPCALTVHSRSHIRLDQGEITVRHPAGAAPFLVTTPQGDISSTGSQFAVRAPRAEPAEVHVREGLVGAAPLRDVDAARTVAAGAAAQLRDGSARPIIWNVDAFLWTLDRAAVLAAARPAVRWTFAPETWELEEDDATIRNINGDHSHLSASGDVRPVVAAEGSAIVFRDFPFGSWLSHEGPVESLLGDEFSVEMTVSFENVRHSTLLALKHWTKERPQPIDSLMIELAPQGFPNCLVSEPPTSFRVVYREKPAMRGPTSIFSSPMAESGQWYHLTVVKTSDRLELWVNGELSASSSITRRLVSHDYLVLGDLLGTRDVPMRAVFYRPLLGALEQLLIYDRALTRQEIAEHAELFRTEPAPPPAGSPPRDAP